MRGAMSEKDIVRITVGRHPVSISGLKETISVLAGRLEGRSDDEIGEAMVAELEKENYIPASARDEYRKAFAREFRKALGLPYSRDLPEGLDIKVLGSGCNQCEGLVQLVMETLVELDVPASLEHLTGALVINEKVVWSGSIPLRDKLRSWIREAASGAVKD